ncbi:MAG: hypothetical protein WCW25_04005 [Patescibacteria group bacterium]|jgi:hypothetical protein
MGDVKNGKNGIKEAIIKTVAFFDLFDYPLTLFEVHRYLYLPQVDCGLAGSSTVNKITNYELRITNIDSLLEELLRENIFGRKNGFYFLEGRESIIAERLRRFNRSGRKISRAKKIIRLFSALPWIKMIALGNVMGSRNFKKESDIDFIIVTSKNRIWITRFFCAGLMAMLGLRPTKGKTKDRICLSFFISEDRLGLEFLSGQEDICFYYWLAGFTPLYERGDIFRKLCEANGWLKEILPNCEPVSPAGEVRVERSILAAMTGEVIEPLAGWLEPLIMNFQLKIFPPAIREKLNQGTDVFVDKGIIKLHVNDRRKMYRAEWKKRTRQVLSGMEK